MKNPIQLISLALAASAVALPAVPAAAADFQIPGYHPSAVQTDTWERHRSDRRGRDYDRRYQGRYGYGEPVHRNMLRDQRAPPDGFEPPTRTLGRCRSIH